MSATWKLEFEERGFAVIESFLSPLDLATAREAVTRHYPSVEEYYRDPDTHAWLQGDPFAGCKSFPFGDPILEDLAVQPSIIEIVETVLEADDVRLIRATLQAKFAGAADYDQVLHRDYPNHALLVPGERPEHRPLGFFIYLNDVTVDNGAPRLVARSDAPAPTGGDTHFFRSEQEARAAGRHTNHHVPGLYDREIAAEGPAGSLLMYDLATLHRGSLMVAERAVRLTLSLAYAAGNSWCARQSWPELGEDLNLISFLTRASPRQLRLFGFPPADDPYWTDVTRAAVRARYPGITLPGETD